MKKSFLFVAALLCGTMAFAQEEPVIINIWTAAEVAGEQTDDLGPSMGWSNSVEYPTFMFDEYIRATAVGATNGVYWESGTSRGDWRVYQARAVEVVDQDTIYGHFYFTAEKGAKITKLGLTYSTNYGKGGGLISWVPGCNQTDSIASDSILVFPEGTDSISLYAGVSASAVKGQVRIQRFFIEYITEPTALKETAIEQKATKVVRNGQLFIKKGDKEFNVLGF